MIIPNLTWFYFHVLLASVILYKDYDGTLEESLNRFEQSIGLYTEPDTVEAETVDPPFYIPPIEQDSTWILPPMKQDSTEWRDPYRAAELILWDSRESAKQRVQT
jgi:hypothetical protein